MSMLDGLSQCWLLSRSCEVNWEAWSAMGTVGAVVVSLSLAFGQRYKENRAQRSRARWIALELRRTIAVWNRTVEAALAADYSELPFKLSDTYTDPADVPAEIEKLRPSLHELGDAIAPLVDAIWVARQLSNMDIEKALRGDYEEEPAQKFINLYLRRLSMLHGHTQLAMKRVTQLAGPVGDEEAKQLLGD